MNIIITGTSSGLGYELALLFLNNSDYVIGFSRSKSQITNFDNYKHFSIDISDKEKVLNSYKSITLQNVDIIINNAGEPGSNSSITEVTKEEIEKLLNVNLFGCINITQVFLEELMKSKRGQIINISSRFGSLSYNRKPENRTLNISYSYRIAKAAQNMFSVCLANELENKGIQITVLHPGSFKSKCGRNNASLTAKDVALEIFKWIISNKKSELLNIQEVNGNKYEW